MDMDKDTLEAKLVAVGVTMENAQTLVGYSDTRTWVESWAAGEHGGIDEQQQLANALAYGLIKWAGALAMNRNTIERLRRQRGSRLPLPQRQHGEPHGTDCAGPR